jgi:hypothetical protein
LAFPVYWFFASTFSVSALSMTTSTAICVDLLDNDELLGDLLRLGGLVLDDDDEAVLEWCRRRQSSASVRHTLQSQLSQCTPSRRTCS